VAEVVAALLADVRARGDAALVEATARFDWPGVTAAALPVPVEDLESAYRVADPKIIAALETARDNVTSFHRHELVPDWEDTGAQGQKLGIRHLPVERAGLYVPGGLAAYASTVVMNAVPTRVAGVAELIICTPPGRDGSVDSTVLAAAWIMGVRRVFRVGGAQAIAAMAYGTVTVPRVDVICGPGNAYVMEAKRQVYGSVGIDNLAGPSEVLVVADRTATAAWVAADLLAQEEHGSGATAVLMAESEEGCEAVRQALERLRGEARVAAGGNGDDTADGAGSADERTPSDEVAPPDQTADGGDNQAAGGAGANDTVAQPEGPGEGIFAFYPAPGEDFLELATTLVNTYAPEHLEIQVADVRGFLRGVRSAGAVFIGPLTPTAFGDYIAGSNHVLPTGGSARFSSPLGVNTFLRRSSYLEMSADAVRLLTPHLAGVADSEGFSFHRVSAELRAEAVEGPDAAPPPDEGG
jgi:histidinol dehydrogenase